jgi:hypothetical protein
MTTNQQRLLTGKSFFSSLILLLILPAVSSAQSRSFDLKDLSAFKNPGNNWKIAGNVSADIAKENKLVTSPGTGILLTAAEKKGTDLFTSDEFGDVDIELDYMMAAGSNSGIYLQGRYELQLTDSWGDAPPTQSSNGAIYQRWNDNEPEGKNGYDGHAPRVNASKAPGTWQHLKISFQAPRFDASGNKIANAKMLMVELNGAVLHENLQLAGPTRGSVDNKEVAKGPLRLQGDHGAVALRNINITEYSENAERRFALKDPATEKDHWPVDPIMITPNSTKIHRSFMDMPKNDGRLTHTISVGSSDRVHYTYDPMTGTIVQVWRGEFLDATPMWHDRGDGSSRPVGAVQYFGKPAPALAKLANESAAWPADTANTGFKPKGYILDEEDAPTFRYISMGMAVDDKIRPAEKGHGFIREISIQNPQPSLYLKLAAAKNIEKVNDGLYLVDDKSYYLQVDKSSGSSPLLRDGSNGQKELLLPVKNKISYTILF